MNDAVRSSPASYVVNRLRNYRTLRVDPIDSEMRKRIIEEKDFGREIDEVISYIVKQVT